MSKLNFQKISMEFLSEKKMIEMGLRNADNQFSIICPEAYALWNTELH